MAHSAMNADCVRWANFQRAVQYAHRQNRGFNVKHAQLSHSMQLVAATLIQHARSSAMLVMFGDRSTMARTPFVCPDTHHRYKSAVCLQTPATYLPCRNHCKPLWQSVTDPHEVHTLVQQ
eukprot:3941959-Rhodomonas_salina.3